MSYKEKIIASLDKLQDGELKALWERIQFDFVPDFGEKAMLRDDIRDKTIEVIHSLCEWTSSIKIEEATKIYHLNIENELELLSNSLEHEFSLPYINPDDINKWNTVADIVNYIEDQLECALHDMEDI